jgi:hypothetical protein
VIPRPTITPATAEELESLGGILRCLMCGEERPLGDVAEKLRVGWPTCHDQTMRWVTGRQVEEERA